MESAAAIHHGARSARGPGPVTCPWRAKNIPVSPTLSWQYAARAARYHLQLAADSLFEFIILQDTTLADTLRRLDSLDYYSIYYWRVRATNVGGISAWSGRRQFLTTLDRSDGRRSAC